LTVEIYNELGALLETRQAIDGEKPDLGKLKSGAYVLNLYGHPNSKLLQSVKIIKE